MSADNETDFGIYVRGLLEPVVLIETPGRISFVEVSNWKVGQCSTKQLPKILL